MADFPQISILPVTTSGLTISVGNSLVGMLGPTPSSVAWPSANLALFVPVLVPQPVTVFRMTAGCGSGTGGNFDMGLYDSAGHLLVSSGATARSASSEVSVDVTDTRVGTGLFYLALSTDGVAAMYAAQALGVQKCRLLGFLQMASAYPLPSTATFAKCATDYIPIVAAYLGPTT